MTKTFRLRRLLDLRERHEMAMARNLAAARGAADSEREVHDSLQRARHDSLANAARVAAGGTTVGELVSLNRALLELDQHAEMADERVKAAEAHVSTCHEALAVAARARLMLDKLRARHEDAFRADVKARELQVMDSIALTRHARGDSLDNSRKNWNHR